VTDPFLDVFLAEQRRADAIRALSRARSEAEVATITRRFNLAQMVEDEGDEDVASC
jgi:hypothetical protein